MLPQTVGLLKIKPNRFYMINIQKNELYTGDLIKYTFDTGLHADPYDSNFFQTMYKDTQNYTNQYKLNVTGPMIPRVLVHFCS